MNYREKQKKDPSEKKIRKLTAYSKRHVNREKEDLAPWLDWEAESDRIIAEYKEKTLLLPTAGQDLYMAGWIGGAGTELLAQWKYEELSGYFPIAFMNSLRNQALFENLHLKEEKQCGEHPVTDPVCYLDKGASWIAPIGEGGLLKALYRLGKESPTGFQVSAGEVPVRQITIEFCEYLLLHPWELLTGHAFLFTAEPNRIRLQELENQGMVCRKIGFITKEKQKLICHGEEKSNINRPEPDALLNLLLEEKE